MRNNYTAEIEQWLWEESRCWRCGRAGLWPNTLCAHHFVRGVNRKQNERCTMVVLCYECHVEEHVGLRPLGLLGCLVLKRRYDRAYYDLAAVNAMSHKGPQYVTEAEVNDCERMSPESGGR